MPRTIYFDYNATTPLDPAVREAMLPFLEEIWGNPSSVHHLGRKARARWMMPGTGRPGFWGPNPVKSFLPAAERKSNNLAIFGTGSISKSQGQSLDHLGGGTSRRVALFRLFGKKRGFFRHAPAGGCRRTRFAGRLKACASRPDTFWFPSWRPTMKLARFSRWRNSGSFAVNGELFSFGRGPMVWQGAFRIIHQFNADLDFHLRPQISRAKGRGPAYGSNRRCILIPYSSAAVTKMNGAPARRIWRQSFGLVAHWKICPDSGFSRGENAEWPEELAAAIVKIEGCELVSPVPNCLANTVSFVVAGGGRHRACWRDWMWKGSALPADRPVRPVRWSPRMSLWPLAKNQVANSLVRFSLGRDSTPEEIDLVRNFAGNHPPRTTG
jgi:hypothetical protein